MGPHTTFRRSNSEETVMKNVERKEVIAQPTPMEEELSKAFKQIWCAGNVRSVAKRPRVAEQCDDNIHSLAMTAEAMTINAMKSCTEAAGVSYTEKETNGIDVQRAWKPSNMSTVSNAPPGICTVEMVTNRNRKMC
ncbi:hypothetical protein TNCV_1174921 [Trichonephila clavipes]|nr:hypothetical protein TNCV_1174921 [Trichonephila clavipes]